MRALVLGGSLLLLAGCGGGGTTGTNYSEAPPMAEIVASPSPQASDAGSANAVTDPAPDDSADNVVEPADNAM
jgi:hypothetical protein